MAASWRRAAVLWLPSAAAAAVATVCTAVSQGSNSESSSNSSSSVVVVGGGVCGLSTALHLARDYGHRVVVLEREHVGAATQASSVNCGHITPSQALPNSSIDALLEHCAASARASRGQSSCTQCRQVAALAPVPGWSAVLGAGSMAFYEGLERRAVADGHGSIEFQHTAELFVAQTKQQLAWAQTWASTDPVAVHLSRVPGDSSSRGCVDAMAMVSPVQSERVPRVVDAQHVAEAAPAMAPAVANGAIVGAVLMPDVATAHPAKAMRALAREARAAGVVIIEGAEVYDIEAVAEPEAGRAAQWRVHAKALAHREDNPNPDGAQATATITVAASSLVLAAGGWTPYLGALIDPSLEEALPVIPVVGQMWSSPVLPQQAEEGGGGLRHLVSSMESHSHWATGGDTRQWSGSPPQVTHTRPDAAIDGGSNDDDDDDDDEEELGSCGCPGGALVPVAPPADVLPSAAAGWFASRRHSWHPRHTRHLYGKPTPDGRIIFGGDRRVHPRQVGGAVHPLPRLLRDAHEVCRGHAEELLPQLLRQVPTERAWGGIMPFSIDGAPLIGRVPWSRGPPLYVVSGLGASGFMKGPMAGVFCAAMVHLDDGGDRCDVKPSNQDRAAQLVVDVAKAVLHEADPARFSKTT